MPKVLGQTFGSMDECVSARMCMGMGKCRDRAIADSRKAEKKPKKKSKYPEEAYLVGQHNSSRAPGDRP